MSPESVVFAMSKVCREQAKTRKRSGLEVLEDVSMYYDERQNDAWRAFHVRGSFAEQEEILLEIGGIVASLPEILNYEQVDSSDIPSPYLNLIAGKAEFARILVEIQSYEGLKTVLGMNRFIFPNDPNHLKRFIIDPILQVSK